MAPGERRRRLLLPIIPGSFGTEYVVVTGNSNREAVIALKRHVQPFAEQLLPTVFAIGSGRIRTVLGQTDVARITLLVLRIYAGG
jgi:hypothetical protein